MRVVITGGNGFLGAYLARSLAAGGHEVHCLDVSPRSPILRGVDDVRVGRLDVTSWPQVLEALKELRPDIVYHNAGVLSAAAEARPQVAYEVNVTGTFNVLEAAKVLEIGRVMFISTVATYGPGVSETVDESTQQRPTTMYGLSKVHGELLGSYYHSKFGVDFRALRMPAVLGAGRGPGGASAYSSLMITEPLRGRDYVVPVPEHATIPLIYVKDAVQALVDLAAAEPQAVVGRTYGVCGFAPDALSVAKEVRKSHPKGEVSFRPDREIAAIIDTWPKVIDDSAAKRDWGWKSTWGLKAAVADARAELEAHPDWP